MNAYHKQPNRRLYDDFDKYYADLEYLQPRSIVTPFNETVDSNNS